MSSPTMSSSTMSSPALSLSDKGAVNFRAHLSERRGSSLRNSPSLGVWSSSCSANVVDAVSRCGFDWMLLDCEHSPRGLETCLYELRILESSPCVPLVRVAWNDSVMLKRVLDIGVESVMVPMINDVVEARSAVSSVLYPPRGCRGAASGIRASGYGRDNKNYLQNFNPFLILQIETPQAVENLDEICEVAGVDALFFGPTDLSANMGYIGEPAHPKVISVISEGIARVKDKGCYAGVLSPSMQALDALVKAGPDFISVTSDMGMLVRAAEEAVATARNLS